MLGPVFTVEIVTSLRRARYIATRALYACALLFALWTAYATSAAIFSGTYNIRVVAQISQNFFLTMTFMQIAAVLLLGPAILAGTIAEERQRRTIEYLFVSDLNNKEIVLGKLAARLVHLFFIVMVGLPVVAIARMLGGVSGSIMLQSFVITLSTIFWVGSVSICVSVFAARARDGLTRAYLWLLGLLITPWIAVWILELLSQFRSPLNYEWVLFAQLYNPFVTFGLVQNIQYSPLEVGPWATVGLLVLEQLLISAVALALAVNSVRRVHVADAGRAPIKDPGPMLGRQRKRRSPGDRPMLWKEFFFAKRKQKHPLLQRVLLLLGFFVFVVSAIWMYFYNMQDPEIYTVYMMIVATAMACLAILMLGARAAATITTEKEQETWQALVSSPLEGKEIIAAKIWGSIYSMRAVLALLLIVWVPTFFDEPTMMIGFMFSLVAIFAVAWFASSLGVLLSLRSGSSNRAATWTLATMVFLGGGYTFCCFPMMIGFGPGDTFAFVLFLAPCSPFLMVFPAMAAWPDMAAGEEQLFAAYLIGVLGYSIGASILYTTASSRFDEFAGRTTGHHVWTSPPRVPTPKPAPASQKESSGEEEVEGG